VVPASQWKATDALQDFATAAAAAGSGGGMLYCHASCKRGRLRLAFIPGQEASAVAAVAAEWQAVSRAEGRAHHKVCVVVILVWLFRHPGAPQHAQYVVCAASIITL
jgi:hypothetical protein